MPLIFAAFLSEKYTRSKENGKGWLKWMKKMKSDKIFERKDLRPKDLPLLQDNDEIISS